MRQVDILRKAKPYCEKYGVKLSKPDLSQFCSGAVEPKQDKLYVLSLAMGVNVTWLMGYDVPMYASEIELSEQGGRIFAHGLISERDGEAMQDFLDLPENDKLVVISMIDRLKITKKE